MNDSQTTKTFDTTPASEAEIDEFTRECFAGAREAQQKKEVEWRAEGTVFAWVDLVPVWVSACEWNWDGLIQGGWPPEPTVPCRRIFRLSLIGGGQIKVTEQWQQWPVIRGIRPPDGLRAAHTALTVQAHVGDELRRFTGRLDHSVCFEMQAKAVLFGHTTPQAVVDRTARTLRAIDTNEAHFFALLDGAAGCAFCNRALHDEISKLIGVGPDCARRFHVPHNSAAAGKRLELRHALLENSGVNSEKEEGCRG
jgi:Family of unknown function (DUF6011)